MSRCVRRHALLRHPARRRWLLERMAFLSRHLAIELYAFAVMENHLHLLIRIRPDVAARLDDGEVARRRLAVLSSRRRDLSEERALIDSMTSSRKLIDKARRDLADPGFFHRLLKEPCARMWNKEDGVSGHFWEARYKSPRVLDDESLQRVARYIDLNQVRAGEAKSVQSSSWTSARLRWSRLVESLRSAARDTANSASELARAACEVVWEPLFGTIVQPSADRGTDQRLRQDAKLTVARYLWSVDLSGRTPRPDKLGAIGRSAPCPVRSAVVVSARQANQRRPGGGTQSAAAAWADDVVGHIRAALRLGATEVFESCSTLSLSGSCYGDRAALRAEALRRGQRSVRPVFPP